MTSKKSEAPIGPTNKDPDLDDVQESIESLVVTPAARMRATRPNEPQRDVLQAAEEEYDALATAGLFPAAPNPGNEAVELQERLGMALNLATDATRCLKEGGPYFTRLPANFIDIIELADSMNELIEEAEFGSDLHKAAILVEKPVDPDMDGRAWIFFLDRKHEDDDLPNKIRVGAMIRIHEIPPPPGETERKSVTAIISEPLESDEGKRFGVRLAGANWDKVKHLAPPHRHKGQMHTSAHDPIFRRENAVDIEFVRLGPGLVRRRQARANVSAQRNRVVSKTLVDAYRGKHFATNPLKPGHKEDPPFAEVNEMLRKYHKHIVNNELDIEIGDITLKPSQRQAALISLWTDLLLVIGPPGSGKTTTLSGIVSTHLQAHEATGRPRNEIKIAVVHPTNKGADGLCKRFIEAGLPAIRIVSDEMQRNVKPESEEAQLTLRWHAMRLMERGAAVNEMWAYALELQRKHDQGYRLNKDENELRGARLEEAEDEVLKRISILVVTPANAVLGRFRQWHFDLVAVDEGSRLYEHEMASLLGKGKTRMVIVGDEKQVGTCGLAARVKPGKYTWLTAAALDVFRYYVSAFERLKLAGCPTIQLKEQYRMPADLFTFTGTHYDEEISAEAPLGPTYTTNFTRMTQCRIHLVHVETPEPHQGRSPKSKNEATTAIFLAAGLVHGSDVPPTNIALLTFFLAQKRELENHRKMCVLDVKDVPVKTVLTFQGEESEVIILTIGTKYVNTDFVTERLLNVATSRQRSELFVISNWDLVEDLEDDKPLKKFYKHVIEKFSKKAMLPLKAVLDEYNDAIRKKSSLFTWIKCEYTPHFPTAEDFVEKFLDYISFVPPNGEGILAIHEGHMQNKRLAYWLNVTTAWVNTVFTGDSLATKRRVIRRNCMDETGRPVVMCFRAATLEDAIKNIRQRQVIARVTANDPPNELVKLEWDSHLFVRTRKSPDSEDWGARFQLKMIPSEHWFNICRRYWPNAGLEEALAYLPEDTTVADFKLGIEDRPWVYKVNPDSNFWLDDQDEVEEEGEPPQ